MASASGSSSSSFESFTTGKALFPATTSTGGYSIEATAGARIYHTPLTAQKSPQWTYSRLKGRLIFGRDDDISSSQPQDISEAEKYWFRLVDDNGRTVWVFRIPAAFEYREDLPFFHVFKGRSRRYGLLFNDDQEAAYLLMKISAQFSGKVSHKRTRSIKSTSMKGRANSTHRSQPIHPSSISSPAPNSFVHVSHIGVSKDGIFEASKNIDPAWKNLISNMHFRGSEPTTYDYSQSVNKMWREFDLEDASSPVVTQPVEGMSRHVLNGIGIKRVDVKRRGHPNP
ncbi:hypothetical protein BDQ17DRAFT_1537762 [Cyathus striatus]|nr:hypothetical protein BDQ17DRAFT_1537762 [Cyathus striatus]